MLVMETDLRFVDGEIPIVGWAAWADGNEAGFDSVVADDEGPMLFSEWLETAIPGVRYRLSVPEVPR